VKNFILFIRRFFDGLFFLALQAVCFLLISRTRDMRGADVLQSANAVSGALYARQAAVTHYFGLSRENDSLLAENQRLRAQLALLAHSDDTLRDSAVRVAIPAPDTARRAPGDTSRRAPVVRIARYASYTFRTARVINNSVGARNNYITLARGARDGVQKGMAVISPSGVVGKVVAVSDNFSTAISILSARQPVSGRLAAGNGITGNVTWDGLRPEQLQMEAVPQEIKVYRGDTVWTTAYSFAPPDVPIGIVERIRRNKRNGSQTLLLRPASPFRALRHVYVVENAMMAERQALEDSTAALDRRAQRR